MDDIALQGTVSLQVRMRPEQRMALHRIAKERGTTVTALVLSLLDGGEVAASKAPVVVEAREPVPPAEPERKPLARPAEKERLSEQLARQTAGRRPFTPYSKEDQTKRRSG